MPQGEEWRVRLGSHPRRSRHGHLIAAGVVARDGHEYRRRLQDRRVGEVHDTHHPIAGSLYYEDQKKEAKRRAQEFAKERMPKYLGWLEEVLARNAKSEGRWLVGRDLT
ncbi:MAG: hypothetical protein E6J68_10820 [Deltaproteobacteria bacterium]|nr:MAG: hypothetical protein E6J68_10820 [Deltaproteobacteria bacterium]